MNLKATRIFTPDAQPQPKFTDADHIAKLQKELHEYIDAEKVLIAAGIVSEDKVDQAHEIVRKLK